MCVKIPVGFLNVTTYWWSTYLVHTENYSQDLRRKSIVKTYFNSFSMIASGKKSSWKRCWPRQLASVSEYNWRAAPALRVLEASDCVCRPRERWGRGESTVVCCTHRVDPPSSTSSTPDLRPVELAVSLRFGFADTSTQGMFLLHLSTNVRHNSVCYLGTFTDCHRVKVNLLPCFHVTSGQTR